ENPARLSTADTARLFRATPPAMQRLSSPLRSRKRIPISHRASSIRVCTLAARFRCCWLIGWSFARGAKPARSKKLPESKAVRLDGGSKYDKLTTGKPYVSTLRSSEKRSERLFFPVGASHIVLCQSPLPSKPNAAVTAL